jgi:hypothetical protein
MLALFRIRCNFAYLLISFADSTFRKNFGAEFEASHAIDRNINIV